MDRRLDPDPVQIFETAIKKASPLVEVKARRIGGSTYQVPLEVSRYRGTNLALRWIIKAAKDRSGRTISIKLANEIRDELGSDLEPLQFFLMLKHRREAYFLHTKKRHWPKILKLKYK